MLRIIIISICLLCSLPVNGQNRKTRQKRHTDTTIAESTTIEVERVVVESKYGSKYRKKGNPAVDLARRLSAVRDTLNPFVFHPYVEFERYEKIVLSLCDFINYEKVDTTKALGFVKQHTMINPSTGKTILPISLREKIVLTQRRLKPRGEQHTTIFSREQGLDDRFSQGTILSFLNDAVPEFDLFADNIYLLQRQFISPLSPMAPDFYKFYLRPDTIDYKGERCVELEFFPFSKSSLGLRGMLIVSIDTLPFIHYADISVPNAADVNYLSNLSIEQVFERDADRRRVNVRDDVSFDISPIKQIPAINVHRTNHFSSYLYTEPVDSVAKATHTDQVRKSKISADSYTTTQQEKMVGQLAKRLRGFPLYKIMEEVTLIAVDGYFQTGKKSYFDIGPVAQFISGNTLEGTRLAFGGITTPNLSKHFFFDGLVAYGFHDKKIKYDLSLEWSFPKRKEHFKEFPVHSLRATYSYDIRRFGRRFDEQNTENLFSWAKRSGDYNLTYVRLAQLRYKREFASNFSFSLYARHYTEYETSVMSLAPVAGVMPRFSMAEFEIRLRYAPGEKIYQTRNRRRSLNKYIPTFELAHVSGFQGLLGGNYSRNQTRIDGYGRINIQPLGYIDLQVGFGAEWNAVPYMLLPHAKTNMSYMMGDNTTFSLMQPLEYLYDRYAFLGITYYMDGLILSRIPFIKYLNLREVFTLRAIYGHLTDRNNPKLNPSLLPFPAGSSPIGREPYIEIGVGIDNILSFFRIDYVWRVTYLDKVNVQSGALLFEFQLKF